MLKKIFLTFVFLFLFAVALAAALFVFKDVIIKTAVEYTMTNVLGFKTEIKALRFRYPSYFILDEVKIYNPKEYQNPLFADSPGFYVDMDLFALRQGIIHIRYWELELRELFIEKNQDGVSNVSLLKSIRKQPKKGKELEKKTIRFRLDRLELSLNRVVYLDRSGLVPKTFDTNVEIKDVYEDFNDFKSLINVIVIQCLKNANLTSLVGVSPIIIKRSFKGAVYKGQEVFRGTSGFVTGGAKIFEKAPHVLVEKVEDAKETVVEATESTKEKISEVIEKINPIAKEKES